jgi:hypothetical protein
MLVRDFCAICDQHLIDPRVAMDNGEVVVFLLGLKEQQLDPATEAQQLHNLLSEQF